MHLLIRLSLGLGLLFVANSVVADSTARGEDHDSLSQPLNDIVAVGRGGGNSPPTAPRLWSSSPTVRSAFSISPSALPESVSVMHSPLSTARPTNFSPTRRRKEFVSWTTWASPAKDRARKLRPLPSTRMVGCCTHTGTAGWWSFPQKVESGKNSPTVCRQAQILNCWQVIKETCGIF